MAKRENVIPKGMENIHERFHYSPAVKAGGLLFVAGQVGRNENLEVIENTEAQFVQAFENVKKVLAAAGGTFDDVVEMVTYQTDMRDLPLLMKVKDRYYTRLYPAWTGIGVTSLAMPGLKLEIKCIAMLDG
jgi:enamine deaminase RidA (YjgF/YER057c/UK114 family)